MSFDSTAPATETPRSAYNVSHIVYALHAFAIATGVLGSASVVGSFLGSIPSIVGVVLNYVKRSEARGTWLDSHYAWQIRTFWYAALWLALGAFLFVTVIGIPFALGVFAAVTLWIIYRIARGWVRLSRQQPMDL